MNIAIYSARFSPGHAAHIRALALAIESLGHRPVYAVHPAYLAMSDLHGVKLGDVSSADVVVVQNTSLGNLRLSQTTAARLVYVLHEPWGGFGEVIKEGFVQAVKSTVAELIFRNCLPRVDLIWFPSMFGERVFRAHNNSSVPSRVIPLLFEDEKIPSLERVYACSYVGTMCKAHNVSGFFRFAKAVRERRATARFVLKSKTPIAAFDCEDLRWLIKEEAIDISEGKVLDRSELSDALAASVCNWNVYLRSTQSGVLPKSFMAGTPVLASKIGSFPEFVHDGVSGHLVGLDVQSQLRAWDQIDRGFAAYSSNARKRFEEQFWFRGQTSALRTLLDGVP